MTSLEGLVRLLVPHRFMEQYDKMSRRDQEITKVIVIAGSLAAMTIFDLGGFIPGEHGLKTFLETGKAPWWLR
jgi:hypothetical protein